MATQASSTAQATIPEVQGMTRSALILRGALATTAAFGATATTGFVSRALAQSSGDDSILRLALTLEYLEATFYERAIKSVPLSRENRQLAELVGGHERQHVAKLRDVLDRLGSSSSTERGLRFSFPMRTEQDFLSIAVRLEDTGVSAYSGAAPFVRSPEVLALAGSIVQIEGRHASALRSAAGQLFAPNAFDKSIPLDQAVSDAVPYIRRL